MEDLGNDIVLRPPKGTRAGGGTCNINDIVVMPK